jgi:hypothetical protein
MSNQQSNFGIRDNLQRGKVADFLNAMMATSLTDYKQDIEGAGQATMGNI